VKHVCVIVLVSIVCGGGISSAWADIVIKGNPKKSQPSQQSSVKQPKRKVDTTTETSNVMSSSASRGFVDCQAIVRAGYASMHNYVDKKVHTICVQDLQRLREHKDK